MKPIQRIFFSAAVFLIMAFSLSACSWFASDLAQNQTAEELTRKGMNYFENGSFNKAIDSFEKVRDWFPVSRYVILAELKIADSHYYLGEYEEAIFAYEEFESLHPLNEAVPYVVYQIGRCYFERIESVDRDQTPTRKALQAFDRLLKQYPDSRYTSLAMAHITECQKNLAGHELYVGKYYFKNEQYETALDRFQSILNNYPDVGIHQKALKYISLCKESIKQKKMESSQEVESN